MENQPTNVPQNSIEGQPETIVETVDTQGVTAPTTTDGNLGNTDTTGGDQITGTELPEGITPEMLVKAGYIQDTRYKDLQSDYSKRTDADKAFQNQFNNFGGVESAIEMLSHLQGNENFASWLKSEQETRLYGQPADEISTEQKEAMDLVGKIAQQKIDEAMRSQVDPLANSYKEGLLKENMKAMSEKYPDWTSMKDTMFTLAESLPESVQDNPSLKDLESLYIRSLVETGNIVDFGKNLYEKDLQSAKSMNVSKPTTARQGAVGQAKTMKEAFAMAVAK